MPRPRLWTAETVLPLIRAFVHTHGRYPTYEDYAAHRNGLPSSGTVYTHCPDFATRLAAEGITAPRPVRYRPTNVHPWKRG